jgi:hypothetical protein
MITGEDVRKFALSFEETTEAPHFERTSFRVKNKIFLTMGKEETEICLMLRPVDQSVFCDADPDNIYPVPNAWGKKGATYMELKKVKKSLYKDAITCAYCKTAPAKLALKYSVG